MLLDEIATGLIAQNLASSSGSGVGWYLWRGGLRDGSGIADRAVALLETGGEAELLHVDVGRPTFQVLVRGASVVSVSTAYEEARQQAQAIQQYLHGLKDTTLSSVRYVLVKAQQEPFYAGDDANQRPLFPCNYQAWRESTG